MTNKEEIIKNADELYGSLMRKGIILPKSRKDRIKSAGITADQIIEQMKKMDDRWFGGNDSTIVEQTWKIAIDYLTFGK